MKRIFLFASICFLMVATFGIAPAQQFQVGAGPGIALLTGPDILTKKISEWVWMGRNPIRDSWEGEDWSWPRFDSTACS